MRVDVTGILLNLHSRRGGAVSDGYGTGLTDEEQPADGRGLRTILGKSLDAWIRTIGAGQGRKTSGRRDEARRAADRTGVRLGETVEVASKVCAEEAEQLVLQNRAANRAAKLVVIKARFVDRNATIRSRGLTGKAEAEHVTLLALRQRAQPRTFITAKQRTVDGIRARLGHIVDDGTGVASVLGAEVVGDDLDFLDCILVAHENLGSGDRVVVVRLTIDLEVVRAATLAVRRDARAVGVCAIVAVRRNHTRDQQGQFVETAARWEVLQLLGVKGRCHLGLNRLEQALAGRDLQNLRSSRSQLLDTKAQSLTGFNRNVLKLQIAETGHLDGYNIGSDRQCRKCKLTGGIRGRGVAQVLILTGCSNDGARNDGASRVLYGSGDCTGDDALCVEGRCSNGEGDGKQGCGK